MKNLLERAKPELKKAIAEYGISFPNLSECVENSLKDNYLISHVSYGVVFELRSIVLRHKLEFDMNNPWEWFDADFDV